MFNILHLASTRGIGGAENLLINLACGLRKDTFNSIVFLLQHGPLYQELRDRGIETYVINSSLGDFWFFLNLLLIVRKRKINLIHSHEFLMNVYGTFAGKIMKIPVVTTVHGKNYYHEKLRRVLAYKYVSKNTKMVAVCNDLKEFLIREVGIDENKIRIIYNGINLEKFSDKINQSEKKQLRTNLGVNQNDFLIGSVANLRPVKGHIFLIQAATELIKRHRSARILLVGRGPCEDELRKEAERLNVLNNLLFLGYRKNIDKILQVLDVFVLPSTSEGLPLSLLEAMAAGVPVIASHVGGVPEIIIDNINGYLIPPANPSTIAKKILFLLESNETKTRFSKSGLETIKTRFSSTKMINTYQELYLSLLV
ncbi:MAG: glycosyltransferase [Candidatus Hodarchaeota archaeon]